MTESISGSSLRANITPVSHPGRLLKRELAARRLSANRLSLDIGVPSGRITGILNGRRSITADTAVRLGRYFGNSAQFWLDLQGQYDIAVVERGEGGARSRSASGLICTAPMFIVTVEPDSGRYEHTLTNVQNVTSRNFHRSLLRSYGFGRDRPGAVLYGRRVPPPSLLASRAH